MKTLLCSAALLALVPAAAQDLRQPVVRTGYHLTARPWKPLAIPREKYLEAIEGVCRYTARLQDSRGAIIDPFLKREHQYATPYFAHAVGTLISTGKGRDLWPAGVKAMEHATTCFAGGRDTIPDHHGEFFIAALTGALDLYAKHVPEATLKAWRERMKKPRSEVVRGGTNNWETYVMKGEWMRMLAGLADRAGAVAAIEDAWRSRQRARIAAPPWRLYHDRTSEPDTLSVEAVGRGNMLALIHLGYDGPSSREIREAVEEATRLTLLLQDPSGQVPANGRTDDHVWVEIGYQLAYEVMAERAFKSGDIPLAGAFRRAAMLAFQSAGRWRRGDAPFAGSYYVTKNRFDPALRVGYQNASEYTNYNGSLMFHLSEAFHARATEIAEQPAPSEIGGYALATDAEFSSVFANAGGMQMQANLRGQLAATHGNLWTPLGVVRFARPGWDTRLGPADGALTAAGGVSFAPTFSENGRWLRMADLSARYEGVWSVEFVHPLLVRCAVDYHPKSGQAGPTFRNHFTLTPDGVLSVVTKTSPGTLPWGVTWPLLENDGQPLARSINDRIATVQYPGASDQQNFIALDAGSTLTLEEPLRGSYGDLRPVRVTAPGEKNSTFIYPRVAGDPEAATVLKRGAGRVSGTLYIGRTAAGGFGKQIDLDGDGVSDATFSEPCGFLIQLRNGRAVAVEADRAVRAEVQGRKLALERHLPATLPGR